ncbi:MAG: hypothetical protein ACRDMJ_17370 [Solirubrobacteraceae bacterium]
MNKALKMRIPVLAAVVAAMAIALAACGGSGSSASAAHSSTTAAAGAAFNGTKLRACLKAHGVTLPKRPAGRAPGTHGSGASGRPRAFGFGRTGAFANPKFRAALKACGGGRFAPGGRFGGGRGFRPSHAAVVKFVACVRKHGYALPTPNLSGRGSIFSPSIARKPQFQTAARACTSLLRPSGSPGAGGGSPGSTAPSGSTAPAAGT